MRSRSRLVIPALCILAAVDAGCEFTIVENPPSSDGGDDMVAGDGADTGDDSGDGDAGCSATSDLTVVYINEAAVQVIVKEGFYNNAGTLASGSTIGLREAGIVGNELTKCVTCDALTAGLRSVTFVTGGENTSITPPATLNKGAGYNCGDTITFTFHENMTASVDVE